MLQQQIHEGSGCNTPYSFAGSKHDQSAAVKTALNSDYQQSIFHHPVGMEMLCPKNQIFVVLPSKSNAQKEFVRQNISKMSVCFFLQLHHPFLKSPKITCR